MSSSHESMDNLLLLKYIPELIDTTNILSCILSILLLFSVVCSSSNNLSSKELFPL